jgi:endonuclease YncB( thermonuclease family)
LAKYATGLASMRLLLFLLSVTIINAASITGKVVGVHDGDTMTVLTPAKESVKVRLHGIDSPEAKQAFGSRAKQELSSLTFGKQVRVNVEDKDRYGRTVGRVFVGNVDVNAEMVRRGFAWWYRNYAKKDVGLATAEAEAKNAGRGLWADKTPVPPWDFRRNEAASRAVKTLTQDFASILET